jgi:quinol-cytochrome oxidoreductase complex cytochrome b subunit
MATKAGYSAVATVIVFLAIFGFVATMDAFGLLRPVTFVALVAVGVLILCFSAVLAVIVAITLTSRGGDEA